MGSRDRLEFRNDRGLPESTAPPAHLNPALFRLQLERVYEWELRVSLRTYLRVRVQLIGHARNNM